MQSTDAAKQDLHFVIKKIPKLTIMFQSNSYVEMNYIKMLNKCLHPWPSEDKYRL